MLEVPLILRALDLTIMELEAREHPERDEQIELLQNLRAKLVVD